ncbi:MAG TPA: dihydrofolate reductase family protein [Bryobacteraceae bacterium]|nr:dihydrofolate reductase family protein [Bryobacteraceae bacterium]
MIRTLSEQTPAAGILPPELYRQYGGDLVFPPAFADRPYVIGNFVSSLDGVVSFLVPGHAGGGDISGHDAHDRFIMGLLRASVDAVMIGSGTLHATAPGHLWTAESIYPEAAEIYDRYRKDILKKPGPPLTVIASAGGLVDLQRATFHTPGISVQIITTAEGRVRLDAGGVKRLRSTQVTVLADSGPAVAPAAILQFLRAEAGTRLLLHEGGPTLFGEFVAAGLVDEFFLTLAPQIAGRGFDRPRPAMVAGAEFLPQTAPWLQLLSVKQGGNHLYLRYRRT